MCVCVPVCVMCHCVHTACECVCTIIQTLVCLHDNNNGEPTTHINLHNVLQLKYNLLSTSTTNDPLQYRDISIRMQHTIHIPLLM